jgi:hypothetical protein
MQSTGTGKKIFTDTVDFSPYGKSVINVLTIIFKQFSYADKIAGPGQRYLLPTYFSPKKQMLGFL